MKEKSSTIDPEEVERFSRMADEWWDPHGKFKPLHRMNPLRVGYIRDWALKHFGLRASGFGLQEKEPSLESGTQSPEPITLLDIGCGGGLVCEPLARLGARVTGIDASEKNIAVAKAHARQSRLDIGYRCTTAEELLEDVGMRSDEVMEKKTAPLPHHSTTPSPTFDIVLALEIIEHVADVEAFVAAASALVKPGGLIFFSTLNRTAKSFALAIVGAEYILRWLPVGTHDWKKFLRPSELCAPLRRNGIEIVEMTGMVMDPLSGKWRLDPHDLGVNYMVVGRKTPH